MIRLLTTIGPLREIITLVALIVTGFNVVFLMKGMIRAQDLSKSDACDMLWVAQIRSASILKAAHEVRETAMMGHDAETRVEWISQSPH